MELLDKYPITVVVPTRNSMPELKTHVKALNEWLHRVRQVVVVDSESTDGTLEYLQRNLRHDRVDFLDHPPGLYESWNAAIQCADSKYTYIATVNDFMPFETLLRLYSEAERFEADITVSAPEAVMGDGSRKPRKWPIYSFLELSAKRESYVFQSLELLVWNSVALPGTLIGSSASNLYRTNTLQENPFPCDYGHAGDSAWALRRTFDSRWLVVPDVLSKFWYHRGKNKSKGSGRSLRAQLYALGGSQVENASVSMSKTGLEVEILDALRVLTRLRLQKEEAVQEILAYRNRRLPWVLFPRAWMIRSNLNQSEISIRQQIQIAIRKVEDFCCYNS